MSAALLTLFPYDFAIPTERPPFLEGGLLGQGSDIALNVLLFMPFGVWLYGQRRHPARALTSILIVAAAAGAMISLTFEILQVFLPRRFPSIVDVVANATGGSWAPARTTRGQHASARQWRRYAHPGC